MPERSEVPEGWVSVPLGDVTSPSKEKIEPLDSPDLKYIGLEHIESNKCRIIGNGLAGDTKSTKTLFHTGDLLYGKLRPYLNKVCVPDFEGVCSTDILVFNQIPHLDNHYMMWFMSTPDFVDYANSNSSGVQLPRINFQKLSGYQIPLPPLLEQHRIVAAIEALFARLDAANARLERVPSILKQFRQAVLAAACDGRLTEDWQQTNAVFECEADYIVPSRVILNHEESSPVFSRSEQKDLPYMWRYATFGSLGDWKSGATPSKSNPDFWTNGQISWVSPKDMKTEAIADSIDHITMEAVEKTNLHILPEDSLIFVVRGMILAKDFPVALTEREVTINQDMRALIPKDCVYPRYLLRALQNQAHNILQVVRSSTHGTKRLESPTLKNWPIALPPLPEQHEIVRRVDALFALADRIEAKVAAAREKTETMRQSILALAFSGRLVPTEAELARQEGRAYEPASVLLERIRSEKKEKKGRKGVQSTLV